MQRFIADASHQLRTPLAALQTQSELALRESDPNALRAAVVDLQLTTQRTSHLANQLLNHARAGEINMVSMDLSDLARNITAEMVPQALGHEMDLGYEGDKTILTMLGDEFLLSELLKNLIDNAILYNTPNTHIAVRAYQQDEQTMVLEVEDTGTGIPEAERKRVLERFYRRPGSNTEGCGLGLAIVNDIAHAHNGKVELSSASTGSGLRVRVYLPRKILKSRRVSDIVLLENFR